jgi:Ca-activated chloride channel family protein
MMKAIRAALDPSDKQDHIRIVCFMTDGYVGDDMAIIGEVQKHPNARVFSFGIGSSVNRYLLDKMAEYGRGEVEYVALNDDGSAAARRFHERVRSPLLTDISVDWAGLPIADVYPKRIPDLFSAKPVILSGRYTGTGQATIKLKGKMSGRDFVREIPVELPETEARHDVLSTLWARTRIDDLMGQDLEGIQAGHARVDVRETITQLGLEYRLMTQFTSFVAVEEMTITDGGQPRRVEVPIEMPEGVSRMGVFGKDEEQKAAASPVPATGNLSMIANGRGAGVGGAGGGGAPVGAPGQPVLARRRAEKTAAKNAPSSNAQLRPMTEADATDAIREPSAKERKEQELLAKLHPSIAALVERLKKRGSQATADEAKFVRDGKAELQIWLTDKSPETIAQLKKLGFEIVLDPTTSKMVIGRLPIEKLAALAELKAVRYIAPQEKG